MVIPDVIFDVPMMYPLPIPPATTVRGVSTLECALRFLFASLRAVTRVFAVASGPVNSPTARMTLQETAKARSILAVMTSKGIAAFRDRRLLNRSLSLPSMLPCILLQLFRLHPLCQPRLPSPPNDTYF